MSNIVPHDYSYALEQCIAAAWRLLDKATDWDEVIANAGLLDVEALTAELLAGQPYARNDENALKVFRLQTKVRIAMRCAKGLPQSAQQICGCCAQRPSHAVRVGFRSECLNLKTAVEHG